MALAQSLCKRDLPAADAVAALSCEVHLRRPPPAPAAGRSRPRAHAGPRRAPSQALQSSTAAFDADALEACPHKSEVAAAADLTALLEGSKQVNPRKGGATPRAVAALPQVIGRLRDAVQARRGARAPVKGPPLPALPPDPPRRLA